MADEEQLAPNEDVQTTLHALNKPARDLARG